MYLRDYRLEPPDEPEVAGICCGCGDAILQNEDFAIFEDGRMIHDDEDCKVAFVDRLLGMKGRMIA